MTSLRRRQRWAAFLGLALFAACAFYGFFFPAAFFQGYLTAFVFWITISLGGLGLLLIQYLTGGRWGLALSRLLEAAALNIPLCAFLFLPVLLGLNFIYPWTHPEPPLIQHLVNKKALFLNLPFFLVRNAIYFLALSALATWLRRLGLRRDAGDERAVTILGKVSGPVLIVFVLLMNFACIDWIMSLNPEWHSSMLVVEFCAEQASAVLAFSIVVMRFLSPYEPVRSVLTTKIVHDFGKLLLAFTCFWTYVTFAEFLITWTGNLPHEDSWFLDRSTTDWKWGATLLVLVHFGIPLFLLIMTSISKNLVRLSRVAMLLLFAHLVESVWWVVPGFGAGFPWISLLLIPGMGGLWVSGYLRHLNAVPWLPRALVLAPPHETEVPA